MKQIVAFYDRGVAIVSGRFAESVALLLLRVALGGVFWRSGQTKVVEGSFLTIDPNTYDPEHIFPALLIIGLATRFSAGALLVMTLVIQIFVFPDAWWPVHSLWAAMAAILIVRGGGLFSIDALLVRMRGK